MGEIDYKELLKKYMRLVADIEGIDFLREADRFPFLDVNEVQILYSLETEADKLAVEGKGGISAKVAADSIANGIRLTTLQLRYPRFIHSEFMTHRMFSRNAASNRAIPVDRNIQQVLKSPAAPIYWGKNKRGMQSEEELDPMDLVEAQAAWNEAAQYAGTSADDLVSCDVHKQIANRVLEPFQFIDVLVTATEWDNFFNLRLHEDAQPEIYELARCMKEAMNLSRPEVSRGKWHLPYVPDYDEHGNPSYFEDPTEAAMISAARCARVSYRNHDQSDPDFDKDLGLANRLLEAGHMSPFEHQAKPLPGLHIDEWYGLDGVTHADKESWPWSNNFRGWIQHRALL